MWPKTITSGKWWSTSGFRRLYCHTNHGQSPGRLGFHPGNHFLDAAGALDLVTSCDILWHLVTSCDILWHLVTSCDILWHLVTLWFLVLGILDTPGWLDLICRYIYIHHIYIYNIYYNISYIYIYISYIYIYLERMFFFFKCCSTNLFPGADLEVLATGRTLAGMSSSPKMVRPKPSPNSSGEDVFVVRDFRGLKVVCPLKVSNYRTTRLREIGSTKIMGWGMLRQTDWPVRTIFKILYPSCIILFHGPNECVGVVVGMPHT